jgi:hypothetical protein
MISPRRRQELSLGIGVVGLLGALLTTALVARRWWRRRPR